MMEKKILKLLEKSLLNGPINDVPSKFFSFSSLILFFIKLLKNIFFN